MPKFILASQSPRRAQLLRQLGIEFDTIPSNIDESLIPRVKPVAYVKTLASMKAKVVAKEVKEGIIISADTMVVLDGKLIGKPKDMSDASATIRGLSGKVHLVVSGICIIDKYTGKTKTTATTTKVKFRELSDDLITWYLGTGEPLGKAGSYGIQGKGAILIEWIKGDYSNVVGLPLVTFAKMLEDMGIKLGNS